MAILDQSQWPLVYVAYPEVASDEFIDTLSGEMVELVKQSRRFVMIVDALKAAPITARQRSKIVDTVDDHQVLFAKFCAGQAVLVHSALARGVITAMNWIKQPPMPMKTFDNRAEAEKWLRTLL